MRRAGQIKRFFRNLRHRDQMEDVLAEELNGYLDEMTARNVRAGMSSVEARRQALLDAGGVEQVKERVRDAWLGSTLSSLAQDVRYAVRMLQRVPGFAALVIFTLALGIGGTVTMFSLANAVLWRPLPYPSADRIVYLQVDARGVANAGAASAEVLALRARSHTLDRISTVVGVDANLEYNGESDHLAAASVSDDLLPLLGGATAIGRPLNARADVPRMVRAILISDALWRRRFGADPAVLGRTVQVNNLEVQVVGVLRPGFRLYAPSSSTVSEETDIWFPAVIDDNWTDRGYCTLAHLKAGVSVSRANGELAALAAAFGREHHDIYPDGRLRITARILQKEMTDRSRPALLLLGGAVGFVLLIACFNVVNLMLARGSARQRELAIRRAMGAGKMRLVRQMLTENLLLASGAGAIGLLMASLALDAIGKLGTHLPMQSRIAMNGPVVLFSGLLTLAVTLLFGLLPALQLASGRAADALRAGRSETAAPSSRWLQRGLVVAEVALSIVPLVGCGLMLRTFVNLVRAPLGFDPSNVVTATLPVNFLQYATAEQRLPILRDALQRVRGLPGVEAVSAAGRLPFAPWQVTRRVSRSDQPGIPGVVATQQTILDGYLRVVGTPLLQGRDFTDEDIAAVRPIAIVDDRLARRLWPEGALGKRLHYRSGRDAWDLEIVGITAPVRMTRVRDEDTPHFFVPYHVFPHEMSLVMKTRQSAASLAPAIRRAAMEARTGRAAFDIRPMSDYVAESIGDIRFLLVVLAGFAVSCVVLASVGLYGTLAYLISQRTREFGVRMALGAGIPSIVGMVVREGAVLTASGAVLGMASAIGVTGAIRQFLYNVAAFDRVTLAGVIGLLAVVALGAAAAPAWRAARIDPNISLRGD